MENNKIQYKILKSEACGHTIEYKMVKKEHELEKARIDEGLSSREKMKAREARSPKEREPKELSPEQYETGKKIARTKAVTATGEKQRKETLKDVLHTHKQNAPKSPSKEDLEYPMAASEKDCLCKDCDCDKKEVKKSEKFYIQKIQELRKAIGPAPRYKETPEDVARGKALSEQRRNQDLTNTGIANQNRAQVGLPIQTRGTQSNMGDYVLKDAPQRGERAATASVNQMTGMNRMLPASAPAAQGPAAQAPAVNTNTPQNNRAVLPSNYNELGQQETKDMTASAKNPSSFKEAFSAARAARVGGEGKDTFEFGGKKYHSFSKDDFSQGLGSKYNPTAKQSPASVAAPAAQGPVAQAPGAAPAAQPKAQVTGMNPDGSMSLKEDDGRKTLTMPQNPIKIATPGQQQVISGPGSSEAGPDSAVVTGVGKTPGRSTIKAVPTNTRIEAQSKQPNEA